MYGGRIEEFPRAPIRPILGFFLRSFPRSISSYPFQLIQPPFDPIETVFPIPISFLGALQSQDYW